MLQLEKFDHVGIRVRDGARSIEFYEGIGFVVTARHEEARVIILRHPSEIEINLIENAEVPPAGRNVLMDEVVKYPGHTHIALRVVDIKEAERAVLAQGMTITEGPVQLGDGVSFFIRDPDGNVIELRESR